MRQIVFNIVRTLPQKQHTWKKRLLFNIQSQPIFAVQRTSFTPQFHTFSPVVNQQQQQQHEQEAGFHEEYIAKSLHAKRLFDSGQLQEAIQYLEAQIAESERQLSRIPASMNDSNSSNDDASSSLRGYIAAMHSNLAFVYQAKPETISLAVQHFKKSMELNPNDPVVYENLGALFYEKMQKIDLAIPMFRRAIELDPDYVQCKHRLAKLYSEKLETLPLAEKLLRECINQDGTYFNAYADLAMLLMSRKQPEKDREALQIIDQLIEMQEKEDKNTVGMDKRQLFEYEMRRARVDGYQLKGYALQRLQRFDEACKLYQKQIEALSNNSSNSPIIRRRLAEYHLSFGIVLDMTQKKPEALAQVENAFQLDPKNGNIVFTLARLLEKNGRAEEAEHIFEQMLKSDPKNDVLYGALVNLYMEKGKKQKAIELLSNAIKNHPELKETAGEYLRMLHKFNR